MHRHSKREPGKLALTIGAVIAAVVLAVWVAIVTANYLSTNPNDSLTKAGGLDPVQQRAVEHK